MPQRLIDQLDELELEGVLAHEIAHVMLRQRAWYSVSGWRSIAVFSPIARLVSQHAQREEEKACDEVAVTRIEVARAWLEHGEHPDPPAVVSQLGHGIAALDSCVTAIYLAARFLAKPFLDLQQFVTACGGDVDTIGAMAGAIWGAANGAIAKC